MNSPTMDASSTVSQGTLEQVGADSIVLAVPGTEYRLHLTTRGQIGARWLTPGKKVRGVIRAVGRRIDVVSPGGRFIEPVYGQPRRIQGTVIAIDRDANTVAVRCAEGIVFVLTPGASSARSAADYAEGMLVATDIPPPGAEFEALG